MLSIRFLSVDSDYCLGLIEFRNLLSLLIDDCEIIFEQCLRMDSDFVNCERSEKRKQTFF